MKICISGSCKFSHDMAKIMDLLQKEGHAVFVPSCAIGKLLNEEDPMERSQEVYDFLKCEEKSDLLYVYVKDGYIGKSVAVEMGYAFAKGIEIITSEEIEDLGIKPLVKRVISPKNLINYLKEVANV